MIRPPDGRAIVYCEGAFRTPNGKTAHGLVRHARPGDHTRFAGSVGRFAGALDELAHGCGRRALNVGTGSGERGRSARGSGVVALTVLRRLRGEGAARGAGDHGADVFRDRLDTDGRRRPEPLQCPASRSVARDRRLG